MFDPRDISSDPRTRTPERPKRDPLKERQDRERTGSRAEFDPRSAREGFTGRTERAVAEIGMYRTVAYKDLSEAHFDGHPYATRRAVDRMIQSGDVKEHTARGPQGGTYKVLTLTEKESIGPKSRPRAKGLTADRRRGAALSNRGSYSMTRQCSGRRGWSKAS